MKWYLSFFERHTSSLANLSLVRNQVFLPSIAFKLFLPPTSYKATRLQKASQSSVRRRSLPTSTFFFSLSIEVRLQEVHFSLPGRNAVDSVPHSRRKIIHTFFSLWAYKTTVHQSAPQVSVLQRPHLEKVCPKNSAAPGIHIPNI